MKKSLFLVALAGLALTGCVKNEVADSVKQSTPLAFDSPVLYSNVNTGTKANVYGEINTFKYEGSDVDYTYPRDENFTIFAVEHAGNLQSWKADGVTEPEFSGSAISRDPDLDAWAPKKDLGEGKTGYYYWPDENKMSFAAFSPADLELGDVKPSYGAQGFILNGFSVNTDASRQYDMLFSKRAVNKTAANMQSGASKYSGIPIEFQHALSSIHFSIGKENVEESVRLNKLELINVVNLGDFTENIKSETEEYAIAPNWDVDASKTDSFVSFVGDIPFRAQAQYVSSIAAEENKTLTEGQTKNVSHPLLLIPQDLSDDLALKITYTVGSGSAAETKTKTVQLNQYPNESAITEWEIGKRYTYRIVYGSASAFKDIIFFAPETESWKPVDVIQIVL